MSLMDRFGKKKSSENAKKRLQLLLVSDRADCSPETMEKIKNEIIAVISKYLDIDTDGLDIQITRNEVDGEDAGPALSANIPIRGQKVR